MSPTVVKDPHVPRIASAPSPFLGQECYQAFKPQEPLSEDFIAAIGARNARAPRPGDGIPGLTGWGREHLKFRGVRESAAGSVFSGYCEDIIYVTGIDYTLDPETFLQFFEGSGLVDSVYWKLELDKDGHLGRHFAFIKYEDACALDTPGAPGSEGISALNRHGMRLKNRTLEVVRSNPTKPPRMMKDAQVGWNKSDREDGTEVTRIWISPRARRAGRA